MEAHKPVSALSPLYSHPSRRWSTLLSAAGLLLGAAAIAVVAWLAGARSTTAAPSAITTPQQAVTPTGNTKEFTLVAQEVDWELFPGTTVKAWTYNGSVPGPEIRVTEGDKVRITLVNQLPVPTTIHWHGIDVPNNMDGVPGLTQDAVQPGETYTYEFLATNPGTRWYHPHQDTSVQNPLGLYGSFIVEPQKPPADAVHYDRDFTYVLSEWSTALTPSVAEGEASLPTSGPGAPQSKQLDFDYFLMNGKAGTGITGMTVHEGDRVRIRLINAGALVHTIHLHGHSFKIVATDGNPVPPAAQLLKDSVTIGPSERVDVEVLADNPGVWMFHCHMQHHAENGMMTTFSYEGYSAPVQNGDHLQTMGMPGMATAPAAPAPTAVQPASTAVASPPATGDGAQVSMVDNRFVASVITVPVGTTVTWANNGTNVHTVSSYDGQVESGSINPGSAFSYTFNQIGEFKYICRQHLLSGMFGTVKVE
jgi:FtsP/CotA-like multicopper oxidase with cupredoxin domain